MNQVIVCPFDENVILKLKNKSIVVVTDSYNDIFHIEKLVSQNNKLENIFIKLFNPLSTIPFDELWKNIPLTFLLSGAGDYYDIFRDLSIIRQLNTRFFLSSKFAENYAFLKFLSSLGVHTGIWFDETTDWDSLADVMIYSFYTKALHHPIEPFDYMQRNHDSTKQSNFSGLYFDDPSRFLHIDAQEKIYLSFGDVANQNPVAEGIDSLETIDELPAYKDSFYRWQKYFLDCHNCSFCPGWRICMGMFNPGNERNPECQSFFEEFLTHCETLKNTKKHNSPQKRCP